MATVVDELVLRFNLDPTQFNRAQQQTVAQIRRFEQEARDAGRGTEDATQKMVDGFSKVTKEVLGLGAAFLGVSGLKELVVGTVTASANIDVMSRAINGNVEAMNRWQNVGRQFGISAETTGAAIANIMTLQQQLREGKVNADALGLSSLNALTINTDPIDQNDLVGNFAALMQKIHKGVVAHPADAAGLLGGTPFSSLLPTLQAPDLNKRLDEALTLTRDQAKAAQEVREEFVKLTELLEGKFNKALLDNIKPIKEVIEAIRKLASGDFSGASDINVKLGGQADEGLHGIGDWLWNFLTPSRIMGVPAAGQGSPQVSSGDGGGSMPLPSGRASYPPMNGVLDANDTGSRGTGRWIAPYLGVPLHPETLEAGGFGAFREVNTDNSSAIHIAHVSITPPPGTDAHAWANTFISSVTSQASSGSR